ncbi:MAG: hypothetical protein ACXACU_06085 [Candidatus Hodarchaeales archaeon]
MGEIDKSNPCPHCGTAQSLTEREEEDFKPVIPEDLQYRFDQREKDPINIYIPKSDPTDIYLPKSLQKIYGTTPRVTTSTDKAQPAQKRISQDIPLDHVLPTIENASLDPASQKVYYQLSIEYQIILDRAPNYQEGVFRWSLLLPDRLQSYGLTEDAWYNISSTGDRDPLIQKQLSLILKKIFT